MTEKLYEFPLNERTRNFMRLENHFTQLKYFAQNNNLWDSQTCLFVLVDLLNIIERQDLRSEVIKELDRNIASLNSLAAAPGVDQQRLQLTLDQLHTQLHAIQNTRGKIGSELRNNDIINSVRQRLASASTLCSFEVPSFYYWLNQEPAQRHAELQTWLQHVRVLEDAVILNNNLLRQSNEFRPYQAQAGFFQQTMQAQNPCQMVRVSLPDSATYFPEASGSKHRISIRFLHHESLNQRPIQVDKDVEFALSCCVQL